MNSEQQPVDRLSYHTATGKGVLVFNKVLANHAHQFAYAPQTDEFEQLLTAIEEAGQAVPSKNGPPSEPYRNKSANHGGTGVAGKMTVHNRSFVQSRPNGVPSVVWF